MFKMSVIRNQKGAGMMMAMVAAAALGGAGLLMGDIFKNAEGVIKKDSKIVSYQLLVDSVRKNIYAGNNCTQILGANSTFRNDAPMSFAKDVLGNPIARNAEVVNLGGALDLVANAAKSPYERGIELQALPLKLDADMVVLEKEWKSKTGTGIKSMRLIMENKVQLPQPYIGERTVRYPTDYTNPLSAPINLKAGNVYLVIEPDHKGINVWADENKKFWIKLYVYYDATSNQIHSCYDPTSEAVFCTETMRGVYVNDPNLTADKRCRPDVGCFTYRNGVIPAADSCPDTNYTSTLVGTGNKLCTWCPGQPYSLPNIVQIPGADTFQDITDLEDLDCSAANPYGGTSPREVWENYTYYSGLIGSLTAEQQAAYAGCLNYVPPCYDYPETCDNNCGGAPTCNCPATNTPDDPGTCFDECTNDNSACGSSEPTCFIAGTKIRMQDGSEKDIEDVLLGEKVLDGSYKVQSVEKFHKLPYSGPIYSINGGRHFFTPNHPFMTLTGWKSLNPAVSNREIPGINVQMLKEGDILVTENGFEPIFKLESKELVDDYVYNLSIENSHEYFADGYLVHNIGFKDPSNLNPIP